MKSLGEYPLKAVVRINPYRANQIERRCCANGMHKRRGRPFWRPLANKPFLYQQGLHQHRYGPHTLVRPGGQDGPHPPQAACWIGVKFFTALAMLAAPCEPVASAGKVRAPVNTMAVAMPKTIPNLRIHAPPSAQFFEHTSVTLNHKQIQLFDENHPPDAARRSSYRYSVCILAPQPQGACNDCER
jgi:hypothetical protein